MAMGMTGQEPVAVLGIGAMGHGMAASMLRAGIPTIVWNRTPAPTQDLAGLGAEVAETAADAARRAAIVVTTDDRAHTGSARPSVLEMEGRSALPAGPRRSPPRCGRGRLLSASSSTAFTRSCAQPKLDRRRCGCRASGGASLTRSVRIVLGGAPGLASGADSVGLPVAESSAASMGGCIASAVTGVSAVEVVGAILGTVGPRARGALAALAAG
jgi:hypothetical protein